MREMRFFHTTRAARGFAPLSPDWVPAVSFVVERPTVVLKAYRWARRRGVPPSQARGLAIMMLAAGGRYHSDRPSALDRFVGDQVRVYRSDHDGLPDGIVVQLAAPDDDTATWELEISDVEARELIAGLAAVIR